MAVGIRCTHSLHTFGHPLFLVFYRCSHIRIYYGTIMHHLFLVGTILQKPIPQAILFCSQHGRILWSAHCRNTSRHCHTDSRIGCFSLLIKELENRYAIIPFACRRSGNVEIHKDWRRQPVDTSYAHCLRLE